MIEQLEERFRLAVADEPPLGFDPDEIVDRAARQQRNRRTVVSAVAAVVVAATVTTIMVASRDLGSPQVGTQTSTSALPTVAKRNLPDSGPKGGPTDRCAGSADTPEARAAAAAMAKVEPQLLADHVPDLRFAALCDWRPSPEPFRHVERQYTTVTPEDGDLVLRVRHVKDGLDFAGDPYPGYTPWTKESEDVLADGSYLAPPPTHEKQVALPSLVAVNIRPDGMVVEAMFGVHLPGPGLQDWVLDHRDAAIALATDPRLTY